MRTPQGRETRTFRIPDKRSAYSASLETMAPNCRCYLILESQIRTNCCFLGLTFPFEEIYGEGRHIVWGSSTAKRRVLGSLSDAIGHLVLELSSGAALQRTSQRARNTDLPANHAKGRYPSPKRLLRVGKK
jgi:hypothetical protein